MGAREPILSLGPTPLTKLCDLQGDCGCYPIRDSCQNCRSGL